MNSLSYFNLEQKVLEKFKKESFINLTSIQKYSYRAIIRKRNSLIVAPTGSGKTESAIIPVISMIKTSKIHNKLLTKTIKCLYITPQRSLNNDLFRRIIGYATTENLTVEVRHGDTSYGKRKKIIENPPDILITTPESLAIILVNEKMIPLLKDIEWVIVDEIHEILPSKRGTHLSLCLERLSLMSSSLCRIGISATIGSMKETAKFLVGKNRKCAIFNDKVKRKYDIEIKHLEGSINEISRFVLDYVKKNFSNSSVLLFTNTRDESEFIGTVLKNQNSIPIHIHHGSLSKESREETEGFLRSGYVGIVVCTSSLELGLDIGSIDLVIHYGSPRQVSKLIQRIGRSRHNRKISAKGLIITTNYDDLIESLAILDRVNDGSIEKQTPHKCALDVLAHNLVGFTIQIKKPLDLNTLYNIVISSYPFEMLSYTDFIDCINILSNNYLLKYDRENNTIQKTGKSLRYYYENVSTIPFIIKFEVIDSITKKRIGTLDQKFVGDYGEKNNVFVLKGSQWRILMVDEKKLQVHVEPLSGAPINIPHWVGEMIPVEYETAKIVGSIRNKISNPEKISFTLDHKFDKKILLNISKRINTISVIPDSLNMVVESVARENYLVLHSTFGSKINNTFASLFSTFISAKVGYTIETRSDPYRILLISSSIRLRKNHLLSLFDDNFDLEAILVTSFLGTYNINWKVWSVAKRFGLISKDAIYDKKIARLLYDKYYKTSISKESIRELIHDKYDVNMTNKIIDEIRNGKIKFHWIENENYSELSKPILSHSKFTMSAPMGMESGILELIRERLTKTKHKLICVRCGKWDRIFETKDLPEKIFCPFCKSRLISSTFWTDVDLKKIIEKKLKGSKLSKDEENKFDRAWKTASLINNFGKLAVFVLSGHGIGVDTCARILRNYMDEESLLKTIYDTEKQYVMTRGFWND